MIIAHIEQSLFYLSDKDFISLTIGYSGTTTVNGKWFRIRIKVFEWRTDRNTYGVSNIE